MKFLGLYRNSQLFKIALGIAIALVCYIASVFYTQLQQLNNSIEIISNSNDTQLELEKLLSVVSIYETSLRNYIITKDETYVENRFLSRGVIELSIKHLQALAAHNAIQNKDIDSLKVLIDERFKLFHETLIVAKTKKIDYIALNRKLLESASFTEKMRVFVYKAINREGIKVKFHNSRHQFELQDSIVSAFLLVILSLLILLLSFNKMRVDIYELKKTNDELKFLNYSFHNAEKIAGFGHWKFNLHTNVYTFSDNFYRLIGINPETEKPSVVQLEKYMHPEDRSRMMDLHHRSLEKQEPTSAMCRYILPNGEIRYIMAVGNFTKNSKGEIVKIGVNYDITDFYRKTLELEENNKELISINAELESFNHLASHDLQEPLRKIQMFISRLQESELAPLSEKGKDYFSKIHIAANRMQSLLIDLLNYSRTIKGDKVYETIGLNKVLHRVVHELASNVIAKNAEVTIGNLPQIKGIEFQIEQMFVNLIMNALKYSKDDTQPKINITAEKISVKEMYKGKPILDAEFHKIVIADNGIGFKQEYADKIFQLFKRLETDPKYSGTGLGLAICKRIIDNHGGFIKVKAKPNEGAKFSIFIPKST